MPSAPSHALGPVPSCKRHRPPLFGPDDCQKHDSGPPTHAIASTKADDLVDRERWPIHSRSPLSGSDFLHDLFFRTSRERLVFCDLKKDPENLGYRTGIVDRFFRLWIGPFGLPGCNQIAKMFKDVQSMECLGENRDTSQLISLWAVRWMVWPPSSDDHFQSEDPGGCHSMNPLLIFESVHHSMPKHPVCIGPHRTSCF